MSNDDRISRPQADADPQETSLVLGDALHGAHREAILDADLLEAQVDIHILDSS